MNSGSAVHVGIDAFRLVGPRTSIGTYTHELIGALESLGFRLTLYAPRRDESDELERYREDGRGSRVVVAGRPSHPESSPKNLFRWNQVILPALLRTEPCDVFISVYHQTPCFPPSGVRTLAVVHDLCGLRRDCGYRPGRPAWLRHYWNLATAAWAATRIVPISVATRNDFLARFPRSRVRVAEPVYNRVSIPTITLEVANQRLAHHSFSSGPFLLAFGLTSPRKGLDVALDGYRLYRAKGGTQPLVLVGVRHEEGIQRLLAEDLAPHVICLGHVTACERDALYRLANCLLFCSRCEGFGYPIVEALRQGCPVIAAAGTPAEEILRDVLPLMPTPEPEPCACLIRRIEGLGSEEREALSARLIEVSERFRAPAFGDRFREEILACLRA